MNFLDQISTWLNALFSGNPTTQPPIEQTALTINPITTINTDPAPAAVTSEKAPFIEAITISQPSNVPPQETPQATGKVIYQDAYLGTDDPNDQVYGLTPYQHQKSGEMSVNTLYIQQTDPAQVEMKDRFMTGKRPTPEQTLVWNDINTKSPKYIGTNGAGL